MPDEQIAPPEPMRPVAGLELDRVIRRLALGTQRQLLEEAAAYVREHFAKAGATVTAHAAPLDDLPDAGDGWAIIGWAVSVGGTDVVSYPVRWNAVTGERRIGRR